MRRVCYSVAMSLDAFIADPAGGYDWIIHEPEIDFPAFFARFDVALMGRTSYEVALRSESGLPPGMSLYVFSRTLRPGEHPGVNVVSDGVKEVVTGLRSGPGKDIWLYGGGELFRTLWQAGLVDRIEVAVIPVLLGEGIPLLPAPTALGRLSLETHRNYPTGIVLLEYTVKKNSIPPEPNLD